MVTRDASDGIDVSIRFTEGAYGTLKELADATHVTIVEAIRDAITVYWWLAQEYGQGSRFIVRNGANESDVEMPSLSGMTRLPATPAAPDEAAEHLAERTAAGAGEGSHGG